MVTITNGINTIAVTNGAFKQRYKSMGYKLVNNADDKPNKPVAAKGKPVVEPSSEPAVNEADEFVANFIATPKGSWTKGEMIRICELFDIDTSKARNVGEAKNILEKALKAKDVM